jgi:flagellar protein FlaG
VEKAITTILLTVASVVAMLVVINATFPTVTRTSGAITTAGSVLTDRIKSDVEIVQAGGQDGSDTAYVWVKNVGSSDIGAIDRTDLFFGVDTNFERIPWGDAGCTAPCWESTVENAPSWEPTATLRITVHLATPLAAGSTYYVKLVIHNGATDSRYFTL